MISQRRQGDMDPVDRHRDSHRHKKAPQTTTHPFRWCRRSAPKALSSGRREQLDGAFERLPYLQALASYFGLDFSPPLHPRPTAPGVEEDDLIYFYIHTSFTCKSRFFLSLRRARPASASSLPTSAALIDSRSPSSSRRTWGQGRIRTSYRGGRTGQDRIGQGTTQIRQA